VGHGGFTADMISSGSVFGARNRKINL